MPPKLGIIAGGGVLPRLLVDAARREQREVFVLAVKDHAAPETVADVEHVWVRLGAGGEALRALKSAGCQELVFAGGVKRPSLPELRPDWYTVKFLARASKVFFSGDDALLRAVRDEFAREGFVCIAPQDIISDLLVCAGPLGRHKPDEAAHQDIKRGIAVLQALAPLDVGQAVIVQQGLVLGIEAIEGTAALIKRSGDLKRAGAGGVLVKLSKTNQDQKIDLPTIGPDTIAQAKAAGLRGIAIEARRTLLLDLPRTLKEADDAGIFVFGIELAS